MTRIVDVVAREILDSRGNPTQLFLSFKRPPEFFHII